LAPRVVVWIRVDDDAFGAVPFGYLHLFTLMQDETRELIKGNIV
jgi:hypothetical protein